MSEKAPNPAARLRRSVTKDELLELYQSIKSADAIAVYDAAEALGHDDVATACEKLAEAKTRYERKHARALSRNRDGNASARMLEKSEARRKKVEDALQKLTDFHAALEKIVRIKRATPRPKSDGSNLAKLQASRPKELVCPSSELLQQCRAATKDVTLDLIKSEYEISPVSSVADLSTNSLFLIRSKAKWHILRSSPEQQQGESITFFDFMTEKDVSVSNTSLLAGGKRGDVLRLQRLKSQDQIVLDESELNVLWAVVRDTKLMPNASEITMIKKNEIRRKQYDRALAKMLLLQRSFNASASVRRGDFRRELAMLEEMKQRMSLREVEKRKLKISQETRLLERAESHFIKVMNSLHALNSRLS